MCASCHPAGAANSSAANHLLRLTPWFLAAVPFVLRWPVRFQEDVAFAGQLPSLSVPSFSQPQPYPLVLMQQATPAQGGGWMVHLFLDACEAPAMQAAVDIQGGI